MANLKLSLLFLLLFFLTISTLYSQKQIEKEFRQLRKESTNSRLTTNQVVDSVIVTDAQSIVKNYKYNYNSAGLFCSEIIEMRNETNSLYSNYRRNNFTIDDVYINQ